MRSGVVSQAGGCLLGMLHKLLGREFQHPSVVSGISFAVVGGRGMVWGKIMDRSHLSLGNMHVHPLRTHS